MALYLKDGKVLLDTGLVATSADCCCGGGTGACCIRGTNDCSVLTSAECASIHGYYFGDGTNCGGVDCSLVACCQINVIGLGVHCIQTLCPDCLGFFCDGNVFCCHSETLNNATCCTKGIQHCCPSAFGADFCCLTTEDCCGEFCCNPITHTCCFDFDIGSYCCDNATEECCGPSGCCPIGFCVGGVCTG